MKSYVYIFSRRLICVCVCTCDHRFAIKFSVTLSTHSVFACFTNSLQVVESCGNHVEFCDHGIFLHLQSNDPANGNLQKLQDRLDPKVVLPALSRLRRLRRLRRAQVAGFRLCWKPWLSALEGKMQKCGDAPTSMTSMKFRKTSEFQN